MNFLSMLLSSTTSDKMTRQKAKDNIADFLKTTPEALSAFENAYAIASDNENKDSDNLFDINSRQAVDKLAQTENNIPLQVESITTRIINELLHPDAQHNKLVTKDEINSIPESLRPQLTGYYQKVDIDEPGYIPVLEMLQKFQQTGNIQFYHLFRQGLDILDLDPILYEIIGMNKNSIGYWFPALEDAVSMQDFFRLPNTKIVKVPLPILQLTRNNFMELTPTTIDIVNRWAYAAFELDENKTYFVKTGTYSSKFDFRNAKVTTPKEVKELGSYLLFIHFQALQMASPLSTPTIYGVSTTNEWCVREYIEDKENNPCIYHGLPLHTEYRVFIDCDTQEILGIAPYWKPDVMKNRFSKGADADMADMKHDYIIYKMHENVLMARYHQNKELVLQKVAAFLPHLHLDGQWSLDIMQNGSDFWIIDMATADSSALRDCIPAGKLKKSTENWIPKLQ